jgi:hypothetical protein
MSDFLNLKEWFHQARDEIADALKTLADEFKGSGFIVAGNYHPSSAQTPTARLFNFMSESIRPALIENPVHSLKIVDTKDPERPMFT